MRPHVLLMAVFASQHFCNFLPGQAPNVLRATSGPSLQVATPEETREILRTHKYQGLDPDVAARFERVVYAMSIINVLDASQESLAITGKNATAMADLTKARKSEIEVQLTATWKRLAGAHPAEDSIDDELTLLITHETMEEIAFLGQIHELLTSEQEASLLNNLAKHVGFANFLYCQREFKLTPNQSSLFNLAARAISIPSQNTREQLDRDYEERFHAAMNSLNRDQFERVAKAKGILPVNKTLREFYFEQEPQRQKILAEYTRWFAEIRDEGKR